jgi:hypothetical protein
MKNIFVYYVAILLPIPFLIWISNTGNSEWFAVLILTYAIPYRTLVDGLRLVNKKVLKWNEIWKLWVPWKFRELIKDLYFSY